MSATASSRSPPSHSNTTGGDKVVVKRGDTILPATIKRDGKRILITLESPVEIAAGEVLMVSAR